jgi:hypothetical protein
MQDYNGLQVTPVSCQLSERQRAMLASCFALMSDRENWQTMTNAQWDNLSEELAEIFEVLNA